jgi:hypothetical protein
MQATGACFERCLGQAPAEVLMLRQLAATTVVIVAQVLSGGLGPELIHAFGFDRANIVLTFSLAFARMGSNPNSKRIDRPLN